MYETPYIRLNVCTPPLLNVMVNWSPLTMILTGSRSIRDVILFPLLRPEEPIGLAERLRALDGC